MRRGTRWFWSLSIFSACLAAFSGCGHHPEGPCFDAPCNCYPGAPCVQTCGAAPCNLTCAGFDGECRSMCDAACSVTCHDGPNCETTCGDGCDVTCDHTSDCSTECGAGCHYTCRNTSNCAPHVGDGSDVVCESVSNCNVDCRGACRVRCTSTGNCNVSCLEGAAKTQCPDGWACGRDCG